ncbi:G2/mitotic-specific cyclin [Entomortierella beljakovae]|nr:G2/mitotic-specific cyclin [Entomortierella beljakovae]
MSQHIPRSRAPLMVGRRPQNNENAPIGQPTVTYVKDSISAMQSSNKGKIIATAPSNSLKKRALIEKTNSNSTTTASINAHSDDKENIAGNNLNKSLAGKARAPSKTKLVSTAPPPSLSSSSSTSVQSSATQPQQQGRNVLQNIKWRPVKTPSSKFENIRFEPVTFKQEHVKQGHIKPEHDNQENIKPELIKQEHIKQEHIKQEHIKQEHIKQEHIKQERIKQENVKLEFMPGKPENIKQEPLAIKLENIKQEPTAVKLENIKQESLNVKLEKTKQEPLAIKLENDIKQEHIDVKLKNIKQEPVEVKLDIASHKSRSVVKRVLECVTEDAGGRPTTMVDSAAAFKHESEEEAKRPKREEVIQWEDLDAYDVDDPLMVSEYAVQIFDYLRRLELETMPNPNYMDTQKELAPRMRGVLIDWLAEVHHKFKLLPETLFLAVNLIDRFLSVRGISLVKFQLVGVTALFIAAKYEEVMAPSVHNFIYMSDGSFSDKEILQAEKYMLQALEFKLWYPNPMNFLRRISKADNYDIHSRTVAKYLMEIPLLDHNFLECTPSMISGAALCLARRMMGHRYWDGNLIRYSTYTEHELVACMERMVHFLQKPNKSNSFIFRKYSAKRFLRASIFCQEWVLKLGQDAKDLRDLRESRIP